MDLNLSEQERSQYSANDVKVKFTEGPYYDLAEAGMDEQWNRLIYPIINSFDFNSVLELAPGHGRNTQKLLQYARELFLVDANDSCIDFCKQRFSNYKGECKLFYLINDGQTLKAIKNTSISFIYSWDSMVHFDQALMRSYVHEFSRVLQYGGHGFVHHSNFGNIKSTDQLKIDDNPGWRGNMTAELFVKYCDEAKLQVVSQKIIDWDVNDLGVRRTCTRDYEQRQRGSFLSLMYLSAT